MLSRIITGLFLTLLIFSPVFGQEIPDEPPPENEIEGMTAWELPGTGAGPVYVSPIDGTIWVFFHQTRNLVKIDGSTGDVLLNQELSISPTALAFSTCGSMVYLVGEPIEDQIIDIGIIQVLDKSDGAVMHEMELEGACNAVYVSDGEVVWVVTGMQYAYQGNIFRLEWSQTGTSMNDRKLTVVNRADCGKIPWSIAESGGKLYVTDLELQWTMQPDGLMGPPYGAWVWVYNPETLEMLERIWVGINPNRLAVSNFGVITGCSGSKQSSGIFMEPAAVVIQPDTDPEFVHIGSAGASDIAVAPDGSWAVATLSDWGEPDWSSSVYLLQQINPWAIPEIRKWIFTGDLAVLKMENGEISAHRMPIVHDSYLRSVAISPDGSRIYAIQDNPEKLLVIPVELLGFSG
ncbi:MAG TPA: hypothetical protein ENN67_01625 [Firmicutes bacterium]|nr:hypothetical protein [Bacillota bacterium]